MCLSQNAPPCQHQLPSLTLTPKPAFGSSQIHQDQSLLPHPQRSELVFGDTHPLFIGSVPRVLKCFSSVRERKANPWVAEHCLEKFCSLILSLSPKFFPANDGHMHMCEIIIYLYFYHHHYYCVLDCPSKATLNQCRGKMKVHCFLCQGIRK